MDDIEIRFAGIEDAATVAGLMDAMTGYYGESGWTAEALLATVAGWLREAGGQERFVLAFSRAEPVALASLAVHLPGPMLKGALFLKDIFVVEAWRGRGVGERMMRFLAGHCLARGYGRLDWTTEDPRAVRFYEALGAAEQTGKRAMRLEGAALAALAAPPPGGETGSGGP
jgi:GNAT superfamily N-acetyltransferase